VTRAGLFAIVVAVAAHAAGSAAADETHRAEPRVAHIARALAAVRATAPPTLEEERAYAHVLARGACASSVERLQVECLMTATRRFCHGKTAAVGERCLDAMDIIVSNLLGEPQLIPLDKRYQIMTHAKEFRRELGNELRRRQGALAVDLRLRMGDADADDDAHLAADIDRYCLATGDEHDLAWPTCVSSLVWFIGTEP
jgi:hypothetical protein